MACGSYRIVRVNRHFSNVSALTFILSLFLLASALPADSQETPLGDVARQSRENKSQSPHAKKVISNEDTEPQAINPNDAPVEVVARAGDALVRNESHRCNTNSNGNSGPGFEDENIIEVSGKDRVHVIVNQARPTPSINEIIVIGDDYYRKAGNGPWKKISAQEAGFAGRLTVDSILRPNIFKFGFKSGDLKLVGTPLLNGTKTYQYQYIANASNAYDLERTINIWLGANDDLPRRTEMTTFTPSTGIRWNETVSCIYGVSTKIQPPL